MVFLLYSSGFVLFVLFFSFRLFKVTDEPSIESDLPAIFVCLFDSIRLFTVTV
jgi:hypothetical protein